MHQLAVRDQSHKSLAERKLQPAASFSLPSRQTAPLLQRKSACACGGGCPRCQSKLPIQTKLAVSQPGDIYEQGADRVAEEVMRMPEPTVQRACACAAGGPPCPKCKEEKNQLVQRKTEQSTDTADASVPDTFLQGLGPGQPLNRATRAFFEPRFGTDFGHVRVHTGSKAAESARSVSALAYTVGRDVVFGTGQYRPGSMAGRKLIAHELTHTIQQGFLAEHANTFVRSRLTTPAKNAGESALSITYPVTHQVQRQHNPGGPYHPPEGTSLRCTITDSCSSLSLKINYLRHTIKRHIEWDVANPNPAYPGGRHAQEIVELTNGLANCIEHYQIRCTRQPQVIPVPVPVPVPDPAAVRRVATAAAVGAGIGVVVGAIIGGLGGGVGGTFVAPGVGTIGVGVAGGIAGAAEGGAIGGLVGGAVMGGAQALWEWLSD